MKCDKTCELPGASDLIALNRSCFCMTLSRSDLDQAIFDSMGSAEIAELLKERPNLFAATAVFVLSLIHI